MTFEPDYRLPLLRRVSIATICYWHTRDPGIAEIAATAPPAVPRLPAPECTAALTVKRGKTPTAQEAPPNE
jgi:hypothetical protein